MAAPENCRVQVFNQAKTVLMVSRAVRFIALLCPLIVAAACNRYIEGHYPQGTVQGEANILPANYRADTLAFLRTYLNDPRGIRDAAISEPVLRDVGRTKRYALCVRFNARKSAGGYEGTKDRLIVFLAGKLDTMIEARRDDCSGVTYQPFPELERL